MANFTEETISVAGSNLQVFKGGTGDPLLVLHGAGGNSGPAATPRRWRRSSPSTCRRTPATARATAPNG